MSEKQKKAVERFVTDWIQNHGRTSSPNMVMKIVTHCPFAHRKHASGMLSGLDRRGIITCKNGYVY